MPLHGAIELATGFAIALLPFFVGASGPAAAVGFALGALVMGAAASAAISDSPGQRFSVAWHAAFDRFVALLLAALAIATALAGDLPAAGVFAATALAQIGLIATTRYVLGR